ncbi:hypothetical protein [Candidatus Albibeggiatoa sp. nov. NOAA]|uniref:lipopolysaccharide biosynthesis protein n=1 Tax=Candidatus Albibeggiatoa sp. nov. NOAA TaxID=3162724 RepID=UPI00330169C6|nr:hypothetical protein [Thiotrichaceae bacterium]
MGTSPYRAIDKREMKQLVSKNLLVSVLSKVFYLATRLFIPPLVLAYVGQAEYGIWAICFVLISYLGLGAFGVSNVYIRYVAEYHARDEIEKINGLISTGIVLVSSISLLLLCIFWFLLPTLIVHVFNIPSTIPSDPDTNLHQTAFILFYSTACIFLLELNISAFMYILNGLQKITETSVILVGSATLETLFTVLFLLLGFGIYSLLIAFGIRYLVSIIVYTSLCFKTLPTLSIGIQHVRVEYLRLFYRFGSIVQLAGVLGIVTRSIDKILAASMIHIYAAGALELGAKFPLMAVTIPASMNSVFLPASSYMHNQKRQQEMLDMYVEGTRVMALLTGFIMGYLAAFSIPLIMAWLGAWTDYDALTIAFIMVFSTLPQQLHVLTGPGSAIFNGINKPSRTLIYPLLRLGLMFVFGGLAILFSLISWENVQLLDIVILVNLATLVGALTYSAYINKTIGLSHLVFFEKVLLPSFIPYVTGFAIFWLLSFWNINLYSRLSAIEFVLISGVLYTALTSVVIFYGIFSNDERENLSNKFMSTGHFAMYKIKGRLTAYFSWK